MGRTRRWRRGQMLRARARDQRFVAGTGCTALEKCLCIEPRWLQYSTRRQRLSISFGGTPNPARANTPQFAGSGSIVYTLRGSHEMSSFTTETRHSPGKPASQLSIILAFASVYFFWGSTYTAIRIGAAEMPALLLAGTRFLIAGALLLGWCRWGGFQLLW